MCTKVFTAKSNKHILRLNISYFMLSVQRQKYLLHLYVHCITILKATLDLSQTFYISTAVVWL